MMKTNVANWPVFVACTHCQRKQEVRVPVLNGAGAGPTGNTIQCANHNCDKYFDVVVPNAIIDGPFLLAEQVV